LQIPQEVVVFAVLKNEFARLFAAGFVMTASVMAVVTQPGLL
jgi:hypothetical protein